jgi:hypothetical protein
MPSNHNAPLREWSDGGGGYVTQANASFAASLAANANALKQTSMQ